MPTPILARPFDFLRFVPGNVLRDYASAASPEKRALLERVQRGEGAAVILDLHQRRLESEIYAELLEA